MGRDEGHGLRPDRQTGPPDMYFEKKLERVGITKHREPLRKENFAKNPPSEKGEGECLG